MGFHGSGVDSDRREFQADTGNLQRIGSFRQEDEWTSTSEERWSRQDAHEQIKTLKKEVIDGLNNSLASIKGVLDAVNDQETHINNALQDLSNPYLTKSENSISAHASKQCKVVLKLSANGVSASKSQEEELRMPSEKVRERLSDM